MTQHELMKTMSHFLAKSQEHARKSADYAKAAEMLNDKQTEMNLSTKDNLSRTIRRKRI